MRTIKFRAWDKENKKFVPIKSIVFNSVTSDIKGCYAEEQGKKGYILNNVELTQFTGLKDKYGREIYFNDIVMIEHWKSADLFNYSKPFIVNRGAGQIDFRQGDFHNFIGSLAGAIMLEIIGNIYENENLLENK